MRLIHGVQAKMSPVTACIVVSKVCFVGAAVVGVENTQGFDVRDDMFDDIADAVDGRVGSFISVGEFTIGGFPYGGDHSQSDVALVPNMHRSIKCLEESGLFDGLRIMNTTRQGWGDPGEVSGQLSCGVCPSTVRGGRATTSREPESRR